MNEDTDKTLRHAQVTLLALPLPIGDVFLEVSEFLVEAFDVGLEVFLAGDCV